MSVPFIQNLTVGDGQVATTATQVATGAGNAARRMNITFANTGTQDETLVLTLARNGGTARRIKRVVLSTNEQLEIAGFPLNSTDILYGATTTASVVDYTVSVAAPNAPLTMHVYDQFGGIKTAPYILEQMAAVLGP